MPYFEFNILKRKTESVLKTLNQDFSSLEYEREPTSDPEGDLVKIYMDSLKDYSRIKRMIRDLGLQAGDVWGQALDLTFESMPVLRRLLNEYKENKPFDGVNVLVNTHLKENTAVLCYVLKKGGANVTVVPVPYSGEDTVYELLDEMDYKIYGRPRMNYDEMGKAIDDSLEVNPHLILEDGLWITNYIIEQSLETDIIGSVEQTKAGVNLANELKEKNLLKYPIITVGNAELKEVVESGLATPESIVNTITRATNWSLAGKVVTIIGYGVVGRGIAKIARSHGARVRVVEQEIKKFLGAILDGFEVLRLEEAILESDILITATGRPKVANAHSLKLAKNGSLLVNAGSKNYEIDIEGLRAITFKQQTTTREGIKKYFIKDDEGSEKVLLVVADGFPINLSLGEGTPSDAIDITLSLMAEAGSHLLGKEFPTGIYEVPEKIQNQISRYKLESLRFVV